MSTTSLHSSKARAALESGGSVCSMPPLDAMWDSLQVTPTKSSHPLHDDTTSVYKARRKQHRQGHNPGRPPLPLYAFKESTPRENSIATCSDQQRDMQSSSNSQHSASLQRGKPAPPSSIPAAPVPPTLPTAAPQPIAGVPPAAAPLGPYVVAGPWASALHPHLPLLASGQLPPVGMPTQVLTHSMLPAAPPPVVPLVMYNSPQHLVGVVGAGGVQVPLPPQGDPVRVLDKVNQNFNADQCLQYLERPAFASSLLWDLLAELLEEEELPEVLLELTAEQRQCAGWFASDPEYQAVCCVLDDLIDSTVSPLVSGVVSEVIDELHTLCVRSPRAQQRDAVLSTALEVVDEMVQEIVEEEVGEVLDGEHLEVCAAGLLKELVREVVEDSYHEAASAARAHRSEQVESFVSDYVVEQVIFEEVLDLCSEGQAATLLTRETITECIVDDIIFTSLLDMALPQDSAP